MILIISYPRSKRSTALHSFDFSLAIFCICHCIVLLKGFNLRYNNSKSKTQNINEWESEERRLQTKAVDWEHCWSWGPGGQVCCGAWRHTALLHNTWQWQVPGHLGPWACCGILPNLASCTAASAGTATSPSSCSCRASSRSWCSCGARGERGTSKNAG